jgi:hypothetical protein
MHRPARDQHGCEIDGCIDQPETSIAAHLQREDVLRDSFRQQVFDNVPRARAHVTQIHFVAQIFGCTCAATCTYACAYVFACTDYVRPCFTCTSQTALHIRTHTIKDRSIHPCSNHAYKVHASLGPTCNASACRYDYIYYIYTNACTHIIHGIQMQKKSCAHALSHITGCRCVLPTTSWVSHISSSSSSDARKNSLSRIVKEPILSAGFQIDHLLTCNHVYPCIT